MTSFWGNAGWLFGQEWNIFNFLPSYSNGDVTTPPNNGGSTGGGSLFSVNPAINIDTPAIILIGVAAYFILTK